MESIYQLIKILEGNKTVMFMCCVCVGATRLVLLECEKNLPGVLCIPARLVSLHCMLCMLYYMLGTATCFVGFAGAVYHMLGTATCFMGTAGTVYHMLGTATCFVGTAGAIYHMLGTITCFVGTAGAVYHMLGTATCSVRPGAYAAAGAAMAASLLINIHH